MDALVAFKKVQQIPYRIQLSISEGDYSCTGKAAQLKELLEKAGYKVRYIVCEFRWSDLGLPQNLLNVKHEDSCTHTYLEAFIDGKWIKIDPTWDSALHRILPVATWNGKSDTVLAVKPFNTFSAQKSAEIMSNVNDSEVLEDLKKNGAFYKAFNDWLEIERTHAK